MSDKKDWNRVSRSRPCLICNRFDWCLIARDAAAAICARVESKKRIGDAGWLHLIGERRDFKPTPMKIGFEKVIDVSDMARACQADAEKWKMIEPLAERLGVAPDVLRRFGVGFLPSGKAWTWPLYDGSGTKIVGLNRRFPNGEKMIVKGHKSGLYLPDLPANLEGLTLLITEGGSDAATGLNLGFWSIGRFACSHGAKPLAELIWSRRPSQVVIVADADAVGRRGADALASALVPYAKELRLIVPPEPYKDLRAWVTTGASASDVSDLIEEAPVRKLKVRAA